MSQGEVNPTRPLLSERAYLACCLLDQELFDSARADGRVSAMFAAAEHAAIWELMAALRERGHALDKVSLMQLAAERGVALVTPALVAELDAESTAHAGQYLEEVMGAWRLRRLKSESRALAELAEESTSFDGSRQEMEDVVTRLGALALDEREVSLKQDLQRVISDFSDELKGIRHYSNELYTGLRLFDARFGPIDARQFEDYMVVVMAPPSVGKSSWARQVAYENLKRGKRGCVFLLETTRPMYLKLMAAQQAKINLRELADYKSLYPEKIKEAAMIFSEMRDRYVDQSLFVYDTHFMIEEIVSRAKHVASRTGGLDFVVIDYVQLVGSSERHGNREQEVATVSRKIKMLAKELRTTVFAICQMNREGRKIDRPPEVTDLRESGAIEQDADRVIALYRPNEYKVSDGKGGKTTITQDPHSKQAKYHVDVMQLKMRNGPVGKASVFFERPWTLFYDYDNVTEDGRLLKKGEY